MIIQYFNIIGNQCDFFFLVQKPKVRLRLYTCAKETTGNYVQISFLFLTQKIALVVFFYDGIMDFALVVYDGCIG